jgi:hypothetical protein
MSEFLENNIVLKDVKLTYVHLWEPKDWGDGNPKYETTVLISKKDETNLKIIKAAYEKALSYGKKKFSWQSVKGIDAMIKDGDAKETEKFYDDCWYLKAKSTVAPKIVDQGRNIIIDTEQIYSGVIANICLYLYPYNKGQKGVSAILKAVQKVKDAERLDGATNVDVNSVFENIAFTGTLDTEGDIPF